MDLTPEMIEQMWKGEYPVFRRLLRLPPFMKGVKNALDFGTGIGTFAFFLAKEHTNIKVHGVDINVRSLSYAFNRYKLPNLRFEPKVNSSITYDVVFMFKVIHELTSPGAWLKKFYNLLSSKGILIVNDFRKIPWGEFLKNDKFNDTLKEKKAEYKEHHMNWTKEEFAMLASRAGFQKKVCINYSWNQFLYVGIKKVSLASI